VPFTISHAAAVLPLKRLRLPLAAMMIGSMSPDFAYFLPMSLARTSTHDLDGILLFCLPVGLALWLLFVRLLERPTIELLPMAWRVRVAPSDPLSLKSLALAAIAIIIGAMTHITWDAFTHGDTPVVNALPFMRTEMFSFRGMPFRLYMLLQYSSSVFGLLALWMWAINVRHSPARVRPVSVPSFLSDRARIIAALAVVASSGATALLAFASYPDASFHHRVFRMLIAGMTGWFLAWCVVAVLISRSSRIPR
jgi:hypothetical protein